MSLSIHQSFRFGECSQICNVKKDGNHTCSCAPGYFLNSYSQKRQKSCSADGHLAYMIVANDNRLQKLSPYKHGNSAETLPLTTVLSLWRLGCLVDVMLYALILFLCWVIVWLLCNGYILVFPSLYKAMMLSIANFLWPLSFSRIVLCIQ